MLLLSLMLVLLESTIVGARSVILAILTHHHVLLTLMTVAKVKASKCLGGASEV